MRLLTELAGVCCLVALATAVHAEEHTSMDTNPIDFINLRTPAPNHFSGGQPTAEQLRAAVEAGVAHVIDLRPESEDPGFDEPGLLASMNVPYRRVRVAGPAGLTAQAVKAFDAALADAGEAPTIIHCASGNRVGAMMALRAYWLHGASAEAALDVGRAYGLTTMEPAVRQRLGI